MVSDDSGPVLQRDAQGLALVQGKQVVRVDFVAGANAHRRLHGGGRGQQVARAVGLKAGNRIPRVLDATAGLGRDAFVLASLGCEMVLCERCDTVSALLGDGIARARQCGDPAVQRIAERMQLQPLDVREYLATLAPAEAPDVIYLDPMFPERRKKAAVKKDMAMFHALVGADEDADSLLALALHWARYRVVVKRPRHAPPLAGQAPGFVLAGESTRFDVYPLRSLALDAATVPAGAPAP